MSRAQLLRLGMTPDQIRVRVRTGRLIVLYRGVYAVGHLALTDHGRAKAALLAAGPHAVASHHTAAALWTLTPSMPAVRDVTLLRGDRRSRSNLNVHHTSDPPAVRYRTGLPVTAPFRTLADLGFPRKLVREALAKRLVRPEELAVDARTRNDFEATFLALVRRAGFPEPLVNHPIGPYVVDFIWPELKLVVETDGWATHGHRSAFEADRARGAHLAALGHLVLRFTFRQLTREPLRVIVRIGQAAARAPRASNSSVYGWPVASATGS